MRTSVLVPPALFFALLSLPGCGTAPADPKMALERTFPVQESRVLGLYAPRAFASSPDGFFLGRADARGWQASSIGVELPTYGGGAIRFRGPGSFEVAVQEVGASGVGRRIQRAVAYAREGVTSFWSAAPGGQVEEWLHFDGGVADRDLPAMAWEVTGASLRQNGDSVELVGQNGGARVVVSAPSAFSESGARVAVRLLADGATVELFVDAAGPRGEALLVDPMWVSAGMMPVPRYNHAAALLKNGEVVACGGTEGDEGPNAYADAMSYDEFANTWTALAPMNVTRTEHTATALNDGTLLAAGGLDANYNFLNSTEIFNPVTGVWTANATGMPNARANHASVALMNGSVIAVGGRQGGDCGGPQTINQVDLYDPTMGGGTWSPTDPMYSRRDSHTVTELQDGTVLAAGGEDDGIFNVLSSSETYNPTAMPGQMWTTQGQMNCPHMNHAATLLADGRVLVEGGFPGDGEGEATPMWLPGRSGVDVFVMAAGQFPQTCAEVYDPTTGVWTLTGSLNTARANHTAFRLPEGPPIPGCMSGIGCVLVVGGYDGNESLSSTEIWDPATGVWTQGPSMATPRYQHTGTPLLSGNYLVAGGDTSGEDEADMPTAAAEKFAVPCATDPDCGPAGYCNLAGDVCAPKGPNGIVAPTPNQCTSGFVADGVCCNAECGGGVCSVCSAKNGATQDGSCTFTTATCDTNNPCSIGVCGSGVCLGSSKIDGTLCPEGICIAGNCVPDPKFLTTSSTTSTTASTSTAGAGGGAGGAGGGAGGGATGKLSGGGCSAAPESSTGGGWAAGLALAFFAWRRRRS